MNSITYRKLHITEIELIRNIDASQYIHRAWREVDGKRQLVEINYHDPDFPEGYSNHLAALTDTLNHDGIVLGAFVQNQLVGFCSINRNFFGKIHKYVLLDQLFVSKQYRGKGIGKELFFLSAKEVKLWKAEKLYICAGSAEETIAFYFAIGCQEAKEINQELYLNDIRDFQLEFDLSVLRRKEDKPL